MGPGSAVVVGLGLWMVSGGMTDLPGDPVRQVILTQGKHLFVKEWFPGDFSEHGGDGLGPVYNATSCVACHHQAGIGGAGPADKNIELVSAIALRDEEQNKAARKDLVKLHPDFAQATSLTLHRYGTGEDYAAWRVLMLKNNVPPDKFSSAASAESLKARRRPDTLDLLLGMRLRHGAATITRSQFNTPALFGAGLIDAIPPEAIVAAGERVVPGFSEIKGRVSRLKDGRVGRFGWKSQAARSPDDFVLTACTSNLGWRSPAIRSRPVRSIGDSSPPAWTWCKTNATPWRRSSATCRVPPSSSRRPPVTRRWCGRTPPGRRIRLAPSPGPANPRSTGLDDCSWPGTSSPSSTAQAVNTKSFSRAAWDFQPKRPTRPSFRRRG